MPSSLDDSSSEWSDLEVIHVRSPSRRHKNGGREKRQREKGNDISHKPSSHIDKKNNANKYDNHLKQEKRDRSTSSSSSWTSSSDEETCKPKPAGKEVIGKQEYCFSSGSGKKISDDISLNANEWVNCVEIKNKADNRSLSKCSQAHDVQGGEFCERKRTSSKSKTLTKLSPSDDTKKKVISKKQRETLDDGKEPHHDSTLKYSSNTTSREDNGHSSFKDRDRSSSDSDGRTRHPRSQSKYLRESRTNSSPKYYRNGKDKFTNRSGPPMTHSHCRSLSQTNGKSPSRQDSAELLQSNAWSDSRTQTTSGIQRPSKSELQSQFEGDSMQPQSFCGSPRRSKSQISLHYSTLSGSSNSHSSLCSSTVLERNGDNQMDRNLYLCQKFPVQQVSVQQESSDFYKVDSGSGNGNTTLDTACTKQARNDQYPLSAELLCQDSKTRWGVINEQGHKKIEIKLKSSEIKNTKLRYAGQTSSGSLFGEWKPVPKSTNRPAELLALTELCKRISDAENGNSGTTEHNTPEKGLPEKSERVSYASGLSGYRHPFVVQPKPVPVALIPDVIETPAQAIAAGIIIPTYAPLAIEDANLQSCFPVSSGQEHRQVEGGSDTSQIAAKRFCKNESEKNVFRMGFCPQQMNKGFMQSLEPVRGGFGEKLLQKMGWKTGHPLGKRKEGFIDPIEINVKFDRKGLRCPDENLPLKVKTMLEAPQRKSCLLINGKHPVSFLMELCTKQRWAPPDFELILDEGPSHCKDFLFRVTVGGTCYQSATSSRTKKEAKAMAALAASQSLVENRKDLS